jgi:hypothetical protein
MANMGYFILDWGDTPLIQEENLEEMPPSSAEAQGKTNRKSRQEVITACNASYTIEVVVQKYLNSPRNDLSLAGRINVLRLKSRYLALDATQWDYVFGCQIADAPKIPISQLMKFTRLKFNQPVNRIDAIQGLVQAIQHGTGGALYLYGLWQRHLLYDLLWSVNASNTASSTTRQTPSWSWQAIEGVIDTRFVSKESVAHNLKGYPMIEAVPLPVEGLDSGADNYTCIAIRLKCPVYRVLKCTHVQDCSWALDLESETYIQAVTLVPNLLNFERSKEMFFAELVKEVVYERLRKRLLDAVWSDGIALKRKIAPHASGVNVEYERVGRGWIKWRDPSRACVPNTRRQVVKIR